jgi:hypothetical protein
MIVRLEEALSDTPVLLIVGPRCAGKTTLVRKMGNAGRTLLVLGCDERITARIHSDAQRLR